LLAHRTDRPDISTGRESQVSVQHAVAAGLTHGEAGLEQFTDACVNDPAMAALRRKIEVVRDGSFSTIAAGVEITTSDGAVHRLSQTAARGSDANPMSDRDLEQKLKTAAASLSLDATQLIDAVWGLDKSADVSGLASLAVPKKL
jgi:2-methylcitrate dehydratase PrpD